MASHLCGLNIKNVFFFCLGRYQVAYVISSLKQKYFVLLIIAYLASNVTKMRQRYNKKKYNHANNKNKY